MPPMQADVPDELRSDEEPLPAERMEDYVPLGEEILFADDAALGDGFEDGPVFEERKGDVLPARPEEPMPERMGRLREKARGLATCPGVYLMKDAKGVVIYVGKSRNLRDRVGSYFVPSTDLGFGGKQALLDYVADFDTLECESEVEALLRENRLIKDIQPRFNARLLDDKTYPYLEITTREDYPGVFITRQDRKSVV